MKFHWIHSVSSTSVIENDSNTNKDTRPLWRFYPNRLRKISWKICVEFDSIYFKINCVTHGRNVIIEIIFGMKINNFLKITLFWDITASSLVDVRFEIFTAVIMKGTIFCDVTVCCLVEYFIWFLCSFRQVQGYFFLRLITNHWEVYHLCGKALSSL
jgi:hypothetical protein